MEIQELISYYLFEDSKTIEVSFRFSIDGEDEVRTDIISIQEAKIFGYEIISESNNYDLFEEDFEDEVVDDFSSVDEDSLISFMNEYYVINPHRIPKTEFL
jgi:hypothetical protein